MALSDSLRAFANRAGAAVQAFARPTPAVPGLPTQHAPSSTRRDTASTTSRIARSFDALFGRISTDAGPSYTRYSGYQATGLTLPKILSAYRSADQGFPLVQAELFEEVLERDAHLGGIVRSRYVETSGKRFRLRPRNETPEAAFVRDFVRAVVEDIEQWRQAIEDLLSAEGYGYGAAEQTWTWRTVRLPHPKLSGSTVTVSALVQKRVEWVHAKHFRFDLWNDEPYLVLGSSQLPLPPGKFVFHAGAGTGLVERRGFLRPCTYLHYFKHKALGDWNVYAHIHGIPLVEGIYEKNEDQPDEHRAEFEKFVRDIGNATPSIHPGDFEVKIHPAAQGGRASDVHGALVGLCNAEMSKRVNASVLTSEVGGQGSYALGDIHADVRHALIVGDAERLADTLRRDLFMPLVALNAKALAEVLGIPPDEVMRLVPWAYWRVEREQSPDARLSVFVKAANELGLEVDQEQVRDELGLDAPPPGRAVAGKPTPTSPGSVTVGAVEAAQGVKAPLPQGQSQGGEDPNETAGADQPAVAMSVRAFKGNWDESEHPRDGGKFAPKATGGGGGGGDVGAPAPAKPKRARLTPEQRAERTKQREHKRTQRETARQARAHERILRARARAEKQQAREQAKAERQKQKEQRAAERKSAAAKARDERSKMTPAERKAKRETARVEREKKRAAKVEAARKLGAPHLPNGKIDATQVPGVGAGYRVLTTEDPEAGYKGRSFKPASLKDQIAEFLGAGRNGRIVDTEVGGTLRHEGGARDKSQWDAVRLKYDAPHVETFEDAFKVLAGKAGPGGKRDWRNFDFDTLRECRGFELAAVPPWLHEAEADRKFRDEMSAYYGDHEAANTEHEHDAHEEVDGHHRRGYRDEYVEGVPF